MSANESSLGLNIADLNISCLSTSDGISFDKEKSVKNFIFEKVNFCNDYIFEYSSISKANLDHYIIVFKGEPDENEYLNYTWKVFRNNEKILLEVIFLDHKEIKSVYAYLSPDDSVVKIEIQLQKEFVESHVCIDPLIHPLGSLILLYIMNWNDGLLIHASGARFKEDSFLFTGVSGIGKSTMAGLWKNYGATVLNDDRLIIRFVNNEVRLYNNPMPYYAQQSEKGKLKKIFLLKQSKENYIVSLKGVYAYSRVLGNFIQQFYQPSMVKKHLNLVERLINAVPVYEIGFKPDKEIVEMIVNLD